MNTEQLLTLVGLLIDNDSSASLQKRLTQVTQAFNNLVSNPNVPQHQTEVVSKIDELEKAVNSLEGDYSPAFVDRMKAIGALPYFSSAMVARVRQAMVDNPMTPAVAQQDAQKLFAERTAFVENLKALRQSLDQLGFEEDGLEPGEAEIGFQIPRELFDNELEGLSKELHELRLIIRAFSEAAGNTGERIEIRQISTSDPLFFLLLGYCTIKLIGGGLSWCLDQWKKIEEIRQARATTASLKGVPDAASLVEQFDTLIKGTIETSVRQEAERLAAQANIPAARQNELANHLSLALEGLLARVERGMTAEIRFLPPAVAVEDGNEDNAEASVAAEFAELKQLQQQLVFPAPADEPVLRLAKQPESKAKRGAKSDDKLR